MSVNEKIEEVKRANFIRNFPYRQQAGWKKRDGTKDAFGSIERRNIKFKSSVLRQATGVIFPRGEHLVDVVVSRHRPGVSISRCASSPNEAFFLRAEIFCQFRRLCKFQFASVNICWIASKKDFDVPPLDSAVKRSGPRFAPLKTVISSVKIKGGGRRWKHRGKKKNTSINVDIPSSPPFLLPPLFLCVCP